jgi:hypothetical protein
MMSPYWFQALAETDESAASVLAPHVDVLPTPLAAGPEEAEAQARAWLANQYPCPTTVVVAGDSQMDLVEPLLRLIGSLRVLLVDRDAQRLAAGLNGVDGEALGEAIRAGRLVVDCGEDRDKGINRFLAAADYSRVPAIRLLSARTLSEEYDRMAGEMTLPARELLRLQACDMSTRLRFGKEWQNQMLRNVPSILRQPGVKSLFGKFEGIPALVLGAGPSLDDVIPYLNEVRGRFLVISVGRALTRLVKVAKFKPHLAVTGDGQELVKQHFKFKPPGLPVVASCFTHPEVVKGLDRIFFMEMDAMGLPEWLCGKIGPRGSVEAGGNVSTAAMSLAVEMGCNPIVAAGVDFSYAEGGKTHAVGKLGEAVSKPLPPGPLYDVPGNYRETVKTNRQMMHYIDFTKDMIAHCPGKTFINVNTDGARIEGMRLARPEELASFSVEPFGAPSRIAEIYGQQAEAVDEAAFVASLKADVASLRTLRTEAMDAAMACNRLIMILRRPAATPNAMETVRGLLDQLAPLDTRLKTDPVMNLIESRLEKETRLLAERMMSPEELAMAPAVRSHWRWREFYKGVSNACQQSEKLLLGAIAQLDGAPGAAPLAIELEENPEPLEMLA